MIMKTSLFGKAAEEDFVEWLEDWRRWCCTLYLLCLLFKLAVDDDDYDSFSDAESRTTCFISCDQIGY